MFGGCVSAEKPLWCGTMCVVRHFSVPQRGASPRRITRLRDRWGRAIGGDPLCGMLRATGSVALVVLGIPACAANGDLGTVPPRAIASDSGAEAAAQALSAGTAPPGSAATEHVGRVPTADVATPVSNLPGGDVSASSFTTISTGDTHACAIMGNGSEACWGGSDFGQMDVPRDAYTEISAASYHSCAITAGGAATCWGASASIESSQMLLDRFGLGDLVDAPLGAFTIVSSGSRHSCALAADGTPDCWGHIYGGLEEVPDAKFSVIAAGVWSFAPSKSAARQCAGATTAAASSMRPTASTPPSLPAARTHAPSSPTVLSPAGTGPPIFPKASNGSADRTHFPPSASAL